MDKMLEHLNSRWFNPQLYSGVSWTQETVVLPLWDINGCWVGYQNYNPNQPKVHKDSELTAKYFTWITQGRIGVWGLETVRWTDPYLVLCEGVFDACRCHWHGIPAIAVIANNPRHLRNWLFTLNQTLVAAVQGDQAGKKLAKFAQIPVFLPENQDVGELSETQFQEFFGKFTSNTVASE